VAPPNLDALHHRLELGRFVRLASKRPDRERQSASITQEVQLGAEPAA
jgi:hypothetical protein